MLRKRKKGKGFLKKMVSNYPVILGSDYQVEGLPSVSDITSEKHDLDMVTFNSFHSRYSNNFIEYDRDYGCVDINNHLKKRTLK